MSERVFVATYRADNSEEVRVILPVSGEGVPHTHTVEGKRREGWTGTYAGGEWRPKNDPALHGPDVDWGPWMVLQV